MYEAVAHAHPPINPAVVKADVRRQCHTSPGIYDGAYSERRIGRGKHKQQLSNQQGNPGTKTERDQTTKHTNKTGNNNTNKQASGTYCSRWLGGDSTADNL
jgi:hypothetical protein